MLFGHCWITLVFSNNVPLKSVLSWCTLSVEECLASLESSCDLTSDFSPVVSSSHSVPCPGSCWQCGNPPVKSRPPLCSRWPKGGYLIAWVTDQGFVLSPFLARSSADSSIHSIRSELFSTYLQFSPFFNSLSFNSGQSTSIRKPPFSGYSQRYPHYPRGFCLFAPLLKELNWAASRGRLQRRRWPLVRGDG